MKRGDVIFWPLFPFEDEKSEHKLAPSNKLLVVIGRDSGDCLMMFRVTSVERTDRPDPQGCHADYSVFRFKENRNKFEKPCWVQYEQPILKEEREVRNAKGHVIFSLTEEEVRAIINCFRKSPDLTNWLWEYCA
jgi:hypothetical protein